MQCVLQNPLASASTLGVSQGAAFGAALGIIVFGGGVVQSSSAATAVAINNPYTVTLCAFICGSLSTFVVVFLSQVKKDLGPAGLILAGVALSSLFAGSTTLLQYFADETKISSVVFWTFGNLGSAGWKELLIIAIIFFSTLVFFLLNRYLIPSSAVAGALLLILADTFARLIIMPIILPIGAITSFLGAPMFLYLLFRGLQSND